MAHKLSFKSKYVKVMQSFDFIYVGLWTRSMVLITGANYYLLLVDDYSRFI